MKSVEGKAFHEQMIELQDFAIFASNVGETISKLKYGPAIKFADKFLGLLPKDKTLK